MNTTRARNTLTLAALLAILTVVGATVYLAADGTRNREAKAGTSTTTIEGTPAHHHSAPAAAPAENVSVKIGDKITVAKTRGVVRVTTAGACLDASADDGPESCINMIDGNFDLAKNIVRRQGAGWGNTSVVYGAVRSDVDSVTVTDADGVELDAALYDPVGADWRLFIATSSFEPSRVSPRSPAAPQMLGYAVVARNAQGEVLARMGK